MALTAALVCAVGPALADEPDSDVNPTTGYIETVSASWNGTDSDVRLTTDRGELPPLSVAIAGGSTQDVGPRIARLDSGTVWVVWTRDATTDQLLLRRRDSEGLWEQPLVASEASESSRNAEVLVRGNLTRIVYEIAGASTQSIAAVAIDDEPDPIGQRTIVATTSWAGSLDARIHAESGHTWITWIDDDEAGWSELVSGTWSSPDHESIVGGDGEAARAAIRETVLGL